MAIQTPKNSVLEIGFPSGQTNGNMGAATDRTAKETSFAFPPKMILITSDGSKIKYIQTIKTGKKSETLLYEFEYTESETKAGMKLTITPEELKSQLTKFFKPIN